MARLRSAVRSSPRERPCVHLEAVVAGVAAQGRQHPVELLAGVPAADEIRRHERPRVDHRVVGPVVALVELDRVERVAAGLHADPRQYALAALVLQGEPVGEHLGHRLEGEGHLVVADVLRVAVDGDDRDGEPVERGRAQLRGAVSAPGLVEGRDLVGVDRQVAFVEIAELVLDPPADLAPRHPVRPPQSARRCRRRRSRGAARRGCGRRRAPRAYEAADRPRRARARAPHRSRVPRNAP